MTLKTPTQLISRLDRAETFCGPLSDVSHLFGEAKTALETANRRIEELEAEVERRTQLLREALDWMEAWNIGESLCALIERELQPKEQQP